MMNGASSFFGSLKNDTTPPISSIARKKYTTFLFSIEYFAIDMAVYEIDRVGEN
jgi:hypothetical protein